MTQTAARGGSMGGTGTSNAALVLSWGPPQPGKEQKAIGVLSEALSYFSALAERGEIESYEAVALEPHGGKMSGLVLICGDREQIKQLRSSPEMMRLSTRTQLVAQNVAVLGGHAGPGFEQVFTSWQQYARDLGSS